MSRELARKLPAETVHHLEGVALPRTEIIIRATKRETLDELRKLARRGAVGSAYRLKETPNGWAVAYVRIKEDAPQNRTWWKISLAVVVAGVLLWGFVVLLPYILVGIGTVLLAYALSRRSTISIIQNVVIKR